MLAKEGEFTLTWCRKKKKRREEEEVWEKGKQQNDSFSVCVLIHANAEASFISTGTVAVGDLEGQDSGRFLFST